MKLHSFRFFLLFFSSLIHYIPFPYSVSTPPPSPIFIPSHQKSAGVLGTSTKHGIWSHNKTRHIRSFQGRMREPSRRKRVPSVGKRIRDTSLLPLLGVQQEHQVTQLLHICRGPRSDSYRLQDCCFSLCEPLWAMLSWFCGRCSHSVPTPLTPKILPSPLLSPA